MDLNEPCCVPTSETGKFGIFGFHHPGGKPFANGPSFPCLLGIGHVRRWVDPGVYIYIKQTNIILFLYVCNHIYYVCIYIYIRYCVY